MDVQHILGLIEKDSGKSADEIKQLIQEKKDELSGLISDVGAAHIIANELGVKLFTVTNGAERKIKDLAEGMSNVTISGRIMRMFEPREFVREERKGAVGNLILEDETGVIRATFWNDLCKYFDQMKIGDIISITSGYVKRNAMMDRNELHLNNRSTVVINPEGVSISENTMRVPIKDLSEDGPRVELFGTIVNVFSPSYFEVCPQCNKRARPNGDVFTCVEHGNVQPAHSYVVNFILDDGTGTVRVACFRQQAEQLIENIASLMGQDDAIEQKKVDLLGKMVIIQGRTTRNKMNNNLEVIAININKNVDPDAELKKAL